MSLQQLRERLRQEFYIENLYKMAGLCRHLALDTFNPVPFFIIEQIFLDLARHWEDNPVPVDEACLIKSKLIKPLENLVEAIEASASNAEIYSLTNKLVSTYLV